MENAFFVTLPSDSSMDTHTGNHGGLFTVELPSTLQLSATDWEVGLSEIAFNQDWPPIFRKDIWLAIDVYRPMVRVRRSAEGQPEFVFEMEEGPPHAEEDELPLLKREKRAVADGWVIGEKEAIEKEEDIPRSYANVETFLTTTVKQLLRAALVKQELALDSYEVKKETHKSDTNEHFLGLKFSTTSRKKFRLVLSPQLLLIIGLNRDQLEERRFLVSDLVGGRLVCESPLGKWPASMERNITSLWVYTNIIRPHIVGHSETPLLRIVDVIKRDNISSSMTRVVRFSPVDYFALVTNDISSIQIGIYNSAGNIPVPFGSPVVVKLHFRRKVPWNVTGNSGAGGTTGRVV